MTKNLWCVQNISEYVLKLKHNARRRRWICVYTHFWLMYHVRRMVVWCVSACWIFTCFAMLQNHEPPHGRRSVPCITLCALTRAFEKPWPQGFLPECSLTENMVQTCLVALYPVDKAWLVTGRTPRWWELKLTFSNFRAFHRGTFMKMPENSWKCRNSIQFHGKLLKHGRFSALCDYTSKSQTSQMCCGAWEWEFSKTAFSEASGEMSLWPSQRVWKLLLPAFSDSG